ncbi:hypothetical protein L3049_00005 [Labilibaculum sp. DW002]|uniref:Uncharacterized protein n=1 Tax=Paralabilibaculum antarcticum TaxID=2912572 RepID=A0ABT5VNN3_9BACT|nr:hypothetical protein [Labilibaculum sp. DW002]MDE5416367.1 hypothetical protein [Labilibaculum sp. DW002]
MIKNYREGVMPNRFLILFQVIITILIAYIIDQYWILTFVVLYFFPPRKIDLIKLDNEKKMIVHYNFKWIKKREVSRSNVPIDIKNILVKTYYSNIRYYPDARNPTPSYKSIVSYCKIYFFKIDKTIVDINIEKIKNHEDAILIAQYLCDELKLPLYENEEEYIDLYEIDKEIYEKTGKDAWNRLNF